MSKFDASKFLELKPGERVTFGTAHAYTENWCDGNGNLGPCSCADSENPKGHWRSGRRIELVVSELLQRVAEAQREISAQHLDDLLREKKATAIWVGADEMRQAPLATMPKDGP